MAESQRKVSTSAEANEAAQRKRDRQSLMLFALIGVAAVLGMYFVAKFISGQ